MDKNEKQVSNSGVGNHKASLELAGRGHDISAPNISKLRIK